MNIQRVKIAPEIDGIEALYINGSLYVSGDEYHDDIGAYIDGFVDGLQEAAASVDYEVWELPMDEEELTYNFEVASSFEDLPQERLQKYA